MAEEQDQAQKTEEPTLKKLEDARKKGEVPTSREVNHWIMIVTGAIIVIALAPGFMGEIFRLLRPFIARPHLMTLGPGPDGPDIVGVIGPLAGALAAPIILLVYAALATGLVQNGFMITGEKVMPKLDKISPIKGMKRMFSLNSVVELAKAVAKLAVVATVAALLISSERERLTQIPTMAPGDLMKLIHDLVTYLLIGIIAVVTLIAGIDLIYQKAQFTKKMRMSRQEVRDELKQTEGDPHVKARLKQLRTERARRRMMAAVPEADVVITNPTHYAVALQYNDMSMEAPRLLAKGADAVAARIREVAAANDIPIVANPPLAQALFTSVEIDAEVPFEHYKAVAEVIGYVWRLKGKRPDRPARA